MPASYFAQMYEYYDGAKYNFDWDSVRKGYEKTHAQWGADVSQHMGDYFRGRKVLELACGGGFWTRYIAATAEAVVATDIAAWTTEIGPEFAPQDNVSFFQCDARDLSPIAGQFDAAFHYNFINHVPYDDWSKVLDELHTKLTPGARVLMGGQQFRGEHQDPDSADFYSLRTCDNGKTFKLIDNIPDEERVSALLGSRGILREYDGSDGGWWVKYEVIA
ncbi:MAG: methyltransferase domain-containing protein [Candidatus Latescibacteria bacterium]|nr:methyltransferase domain-containing protein [Candidatus Latescibacterota bacterium]